MKWMHEHGCYIIVWTCRSGDVLKLATDFLDNNGVCYDAVNENWPGLPFETSRKICADTYIDDCSLGFTVNWMEIKKMIKQKMLEKVAQEIVQLQEEQESLQKIAADVMLRNRIKYIWENVKKTVSAKIEQIDKLKEMLRETLSSGKYTFSVGRDREWITELLADLVGGMYNKKYWEKEFVNLSMPQKA
jgi:hypothetical protein